MLCHQTSPEGFDVRRQHPNLLPWAKIIKLRVLFFHSRKLHKQTNKELNLVLLCTPAISLDVKYHSDGLCSWLDMVKSAQSN